jgi:cell division protease FtsH
LTELAELLLEKEVIFSEDLERIFGKRRAEVLKDEREAAAKQLAPANPGSEKPAGEAPAEVKKNSSGEVSPDNNKNSGEGSKTEIKEKE